MNVTKIEWVVNPDGSQGYTWNVGTGCLGPNGDGVRCPYCFADELANTRLKERYLANPFVIAGDSADPFAPRWWPKRLYEPVQRKKSSGIFTVDMGDLFGDWMPEDCIQAVLDEVQRYYWHRFYFLTKNPRRLAEFNSWPPNAWVGATATDQQSMEKAITGLQDVQANVRYISFEPLVGPINDIPWDAINWAILGPCTGRMASRYLCKREWIDEIQAAADTAGVAVFEKDACAKLIKDRPLRREWPNANNRSVP